MSPILSSSSSGAEDSMKDEWNLNLYNINQNQNLHKYKGSDFSGGIKSKKIDQETNKISSQKFQMQDMKVINKESTYDQWDISERDNSFDT